MFNLKLAIHSLSFVLSGLQYTLGIAAVSFILGTILGFLFVLMKRSPFLVLRLIANFHVSFMRGTPTLVFLFLLYFGLPYFKIQLPAIICSIICFSIVSSAYICEVLRSSIDAVDYGQWEASTSLGLNYFQTLRRVIASAGINFFKSLTSFSVTKLITNPSFPILPVLPER